MPMLGVRPVFGGQGKPQHVVIKIVVDQKD